MSRKDGVNELIESIRVLLEDENIDPTLRINARATILNQRVRMERQRRWNDLESYLREEEKALRAEIERASAKKERAKLEEIRKKREEEKAKKVRLVVGGLGFCITSLMPLGMTIASKWPW